MNSNMNSTVITMGAEEFKNLTTEVKKLSPAVILPDIINLSA